MRGVSELESQLPDNDDPDAEQHYSSDQQRFYQTTLIQSRPSRFSEEYLAQVLQDFVVRRRKLGDSFQPGGLSVLIEQSSPDVADFLCKKHYMAVHSALKAFQHSECALCGQTSTIIKALPVPEDGDEVYEHLFLEAISLLIESFTDNSTVNVTPTGTENAMPTDTDADI